MEPAGQGLDVIAGHRVSQNVSYLPEPQDISAYPQLFGGILHPQW